MVVFLSKKMSSTAGLINQAVAALAADMSNMQITVSNSRGHCFLSNEMR